MHKKTKIIASILLACLFGATISCGQKGPLVLPDTVSVHENTHLKLDVDEKH